MNKLCILKPKVIDKRKKKSLLLNIIFIMTLAWNCPNLEANNTILQLEFNDLKTEG